MCQKKAAPMSRSGSHAALAANKCSHVISKTYSAAKYEGHSSKYSQQKHIMTPKVRIIYIYEPKIIKTDPQNFRSLVQRLTGKYTHKSKEKKRQRKDKSPSSEVIAAEVVTENLEYIVDRYDQLPIMENETTKFSTEDCSGFCKGFGDMGMIFPSVMNQGLEDEIPLIPPVLVNQGFQSANNPGRKMNHKSLSFEVIAGEVCKENLDYSFYRHEQLPIMENKTTIFSTEECTGFSQGFSDADTVFPSLMDQRLLDEIPLVWNSYIPFCNMYDEIGVYKWA